MENEIVTQLSISTEILLLVLGILTMKVSFTSLFNVFFFCCFNLIVFFTIAKTELNKNEYISWKPANWVNALGMDRFFTMDNNGNLTINDHGLFFIYAQVRLKQSPL